MDVYKVYVKTDDQGRILAVNSDAFINDVEGWTLIDEGNGDKYHHAQGNYFDKPLKTFENVSQYKIENGEVVERTEEEIQADIEPQEEIPATEDRLAALEQAGLERDSALMELAEMISTLMGGVL